jgi:hypothetical protein
VNPQGLSLATAGEPRERWRGMATEKRLIDANALMAQLEERQAFLVKEYGHRDHYTSGFVEATDKVEQAPTVDAVEVVHGRWIMYLDGDSIVPDRFYRCSECCDRGWGRKWPYCPNCGAKMDLKGE